MSTSFEDIAVRLERLLPATKAAEINVDWLSPGRVAVGRDSREHYCLLIACPKIEASFEIVRSAFRMGQWQTTSGDLVLGNLLELPSADAFRTATAAVAAELFRRGVDSRPPGEVFAEIESFVALILRRVLLPETYLLGLVGELLFLREILIGYGEARYQMSDATVCWRGWQRQSRDFVLGRAAIEVKTTGLEVSRHAISGLDQIEPRMVDGAASEELFLVSVGIRAALASGFSVASLTDDVLKLLTPEPDTTLAHHARVVFLDRLKTYGPDGFQGYDHETARTQTPYTQSFTTTFSPRVFNMMDVNLRIIRRKDIAEHYPFVLPLGIQYTLELPDAVPGSIENPRHDLRATVRSILQANAAVP